MKPGKIGIYLAVALLIMGFSYSGWQAFVHSSDESANSDVEVIRLAHWQLEPGVREAIDEIAADYMKLHPDVKVERCRFRARSGNSGCAPNWSAVIHPT